MWGKALLFEAMRVLKEEEILLLLKECLLLQEMSHLLADHLSGLLISKGEQAAF